MEAHLKHLLQPLSQKLSCHWCYQSKACVNLNFRSLQKQFSFNEVADKRLTFVILNDLKTALKWKWLILNSVTLVFLCECVFIWRCQIEWSAKLTQRKPYSPTIPPIQLNGFLVLSIFQGLSLKHSWISLTFNKKIND